MKIILFALLFLCNFSKSNAQNNCITDLTLKSKSGYMMYGENKYGAMFDIKATFDSLKIVIKFIGNPGKDSLTLNIISMESCNAISKTFKIASFLCTSNDGYNDSLQTFKSKAILIKNKDKYTFDFVVNEGVENKMHFDMIIYVPKLKKPKK